MEKNRRRVLRQMDRMQELRFAENLTFPSEQVIVISANMGCSHCRQRVTKVVSKMNGLLDYMVDFSKKEVTVRGSVVSKKNRSPRISDQIKKRLFTHCMSLLRLMCCCNL